MRWRGLPFVASVLLAIPARAMVPSSEINANFGQQQCAMAEGCDGPAPAPSPAPAPAPTPAPSAAPTAATKKPNAPSDNSKNTKTNATGSANSTAAKPPDPCIARTQTAAQSCQAQLSSARKACDGNQLQSMKNEGQATSNHLSGQENTAAACGTSNEYQTRYAQAVQQFAQSCDQGVQACKASCQQAASSAQSCSAAEVRGAVAAIQNGLDECVNGELSQRPSQAAQEQTAAQQQAKDAGSCNAKALAGEQKNDGGSGPLKQTPTSEITPSGGAILTGVHASETIPAGTITAPNANHELAALPGTPRHVDEAVKTNSIWIGGAGADPDNEAPKVDTSLPPLPLGMNKEKTRPDVLKGTRGGAGGRGRSPLPLPLPLSLSSESEESESSSASARSRTGTPDLRGFLPDVPATREPAARASGAELSATEDFFTHVHLRYVDLDDTFFTPSENP